jgi:zinc protease
MPRCLGLTIAFALLTSTAGADTVTSFHLDNGLDIVVIEDHRAPVVTHMVWYRAGSADEVAGKSGIAHFLEHLMFKGTDEVGPGELSAIVEAQGGNDNAFTTWDYTAYFQHVAADRLDLMMKLEADRMRDLRLAEADVKTELQVILEERAQRTDGDPGALLTEQVDAAMFQNLRYGVPIIGWRHEMETLNRDDALAWYTRYYAPNNAILVVAGDVVPEDVLKMAKLHYGPLKPTVGLMPRVRPSEPQQLSERRLTLADERVSQPYVSRTYLAPERNSGDQKKAAALAILAQLLGGSGTTSVLARALQFDSQTAVYSSAFYDGTSIDSATFGLAVVPLPGVSLQQAEDAMDGVIAKFLKDGVEPAAFARIKTQIAAANIYARDDVDGLARKYGEALAIGLTIKDVQDWPNILAAVTPEEVMMAANEVFDKRHSVTGWLIKDEGVAQ